MIVEAIVSSVVVGYIRKGRLSNIQHIDVKGIALIFISAFMQLAIFRGASREGNAFQQILDEQFFFLHLLSYILLLFAIGLNFNIKAMWFIFLGTFLNGFVIAFNQGKMPVRVPKDYIATFDSGHTLLIESTRFKWLADVIILDRPYPLPKIISLGDIFLIIGIFMVIQIWMCPKKETKG